MSELVKGETWVRFGSNGVGFSDHQNRFSRGVCVGNWVENGFGDILKAKAQPCVIDPLTTHLVAYQPFDGAEPAQITKAAKDHVPADIMFGKSSEASYGCSTYDLTHGLHDSKRPVQDMLWSNSTLKNSQVPTTGPQKTSLLEKKRAEWQEQKADPMQTVYSQQYVPREGEKLVPHLAKREFCATHDHTFHKIGLRG